jgi:nicotinate-nucleotide adenylyltransferase
MLSLAIAGHPPFRVDELEKDRPGPSYTADTLAELSAKHPNVDWHFILGSDSLPDLPLWHEPARVLRMARLLVVARPGHPIMPTPELKAALTLPPDVELRLQVIESPLIAISSSDLRRRAKEGRSLCFLVPRAVEAYIEDKGLYRA